MLNKLESLKLNDGKQTERLNSLWLELNQLQRKMKSIKLPKIVIRWRSLIILFDLLKLKDLLKLRLVNKNFCEQVNEYLHFLLENKKNLLNRLMVDDEQLSSSIPNLNQQIFDEKLQKRQEKYEKVNVKYVGQPNQYPYNPFLQIPHLFELLEAQGHDLSTLSIDELNLKEKLVCVDFSHLDKIARVAKQQEFERILVQPQPNQYFGFFIKSCKIWLKFSQIRCYKKIMRRYQLRFKIQKLEKKEIPLLEKILRLEVQEQQRQAP